MRLQMRCIAGYKQMKQSPFAHIAELLQMDLATLTTPQRALLTSLTIGPAPLVVNQLFFTPFPVYGRLLPRAQVIDVTLSTMQYWRWDHLMSRMGVRPFPSSVSVRHLLLHAAPEISVQGLRVVPLIGQLDVLTITALVDVVQQVYPSPSQCYFYLHGSSNLGSEAAYLYRGPTAALTRLRVQSAQDHETPTMCWATDESWCITIPQDSPCAYIGGSTMLIEAMLGDGQLEVYPAVGTDPVEDWLAR